MSIMPFPAYLLGVSAAAAPRVISVQDFASGSATGDQDVTSTRITGLTPKGTVYFGTSYETASGSSETPTAMLNIAFSDTNVFNKGTVTRSSDNVAATQCLSFQGNIFRRLVNSGGTQLETASVGNISGGVRFNYTTNDATDRRAALTMFAGAGFTLLAANISLGTGTSAIDVTGPGFEPQIVFFTGSSGNYILTTQTAFWNFFGIAHWDGTTLTQRSVWTGENNGVAAGGSPFMTVATDCIGGQMGLSGEGANYKLTASAFDSAGFSITPSSSAGNDSCSYLAVKSVGGRSKLMSITAPTSTGSWAITGVGFKPQYCLLILTNCEAFDTFAVATSDLQSGLAFNQIGPDEQWSTVIRIDSGADNTDTASDCQSGIRGASATSTSAFAATFTSFDSDGMTLNVSAAQGTGKVGFALFIEE